MISSSQASSFQATPLPALPPGRTGFSLLPASVTGITFTNQLDLLRGLVNQNLMNGSGVAAGDIDKDGLCDLYFCGLDVPNRLYRNQGGWKFTDVTEQAGVACPGQDSTGAGFVDLDADGDLDLLVTALGPGVRLFLNDGQGRFAEGTDRAGLRRAAGSTSLALADIEGDGDLDLYVANIPRRPVRNELSVTYQIKHTQGEPRVVAINGVPTTSPELVGRFKVSPQGEVIEYGEPDHFYLNNGDGTFTLLSFTDGRFLDEDGQVLASTPMDWGLAARFHDVNQDGRPDLYVCNDLFTPDRFWLNQGGGRFRAIPHLALRHTSLASMGIDVADVNRDGHYDFFVSDMLSLDRQLRMTQFAHVPPKLWEDGVIGGRLQFNHNSLCLNRGDMTFAEISAYSGLAASDWSWGGVFLDVDLDGYEDLLIPNGQQRNLAHADFASRVERVQRTRGRISLQEMKSIAEEFPPLEVPNLAYRNRGDLTFEETGTAWGFDTPTASQGLALADLDNDGDLDVAVNNLLQSAGIYRNETAAPRLAVRLTGMARNTAGIGAQIKVLGGPMPQQQEMICGGRYLSGDQAIRVFATGASDRLTIEVLWPSGKRSRVSEARPGNLYEVRELAASAERTATVVAREEPLFFEDVSEQLQHAHSEHAFNDFQWQPLLPYRLTRRGPGITWCDLNGDQLDDLVIPGGQGGAMALYLNQGGQAFRPMTVEGVAAPLAADQTTVLAWRPSGKTNVLLLAGFAAYKPAPASHPSLSFIDLARPGSSSDIGRLEGPVGPLAMADIDGDGDLDLFVGTTSMSGRHPEPGSGYLFRNDRGAMVLAEHWPKLGIVKGAVFTDLNLDGYPELALACEWGALRVFSNQAGELKEDATAAWGLLSSTGLWQGITTGDFDGDGRPDLAAANWGLNSSLRASAARPLIFYYGDLDEDGRVEILEISLDPATQREHLAANLNLVAQSLPGVRARIPDYHTYSRMTLQELLGESMAKLTRLEIATLASAVFLNRGDHFISRPLPAEAQFSPAFGIVAADWDGDGADDLFLSQNNFGVGMGMTRQDAGRGLWLRGDGQGQFHPVPGQTSGLLLYGEQRGCAVSDFDADGRVDLAVAQNNEQTKLFRNRGGRPGMRVALRGPAGNRPGIGAVLRTGRGDKWGPGREVQAGSGYWSMNSSTVVLPLADGPRQVEVRWPGGHTTLRDIPAGATELAVDF